MNLQTVQWQTNQIKIIDQTQLPQRLKYLYLNNLKSVYQAIKKMQVRGAPALGALTALGVYLGIKDINTENFFKFNQQLNRVIKYLANSRPTARNLFWALERMREVVLKNKNKPIKEIKKIIFKEAQKIIEEDKLSCRKIAEYGNRLIKNKDNILTICNAGILATIDYGTALGIIYRAFSNGKKINVFASETRPMLQGARLTSWELKQKGIPVTLITDNMAATLMQAKKIDKIIVGADRIINDGYVVNKIGTYNLAVLSKYHRIPFYVAAPVSTFDLKTKSIKDIIIEQRSEKEVTKLFFKKPIAPKGIKVFNPAFDITPPDLITAIITEKGIIKPPYIKNIKRLMQNNKAQNSK